MSHPPERDALLRAIEDLESTVAEFPSGSTALVTPVLLQRLESLHMAAGNSRDVELVAMLERLHRRIATGRGLDS